ncbi:hypothetical protein CTEN210_00810 [Chaetoceros tenuissimus]|uniref:Leucine-rich repeat domain-containing protein n=1 Tax=Chaetoceros tenuissimus TaxID=426638 RepID=A0AAD3CEH9_9STRA|nr:hypothetical protein CTEN210_00810 [Chaetoceros tenuissimus]
MRVADVGGLVTLFYDGSKSLVDETLSLEFLNEYFDYGRNINGWGSYSETDKCDRFVRERESWQEVVVMDGVTEIPRITFIFCHNIQRVIFADSVIRIEGGAFEGCRNLEFVKLSTNLEYIGLAAFFKCNLSSIFIPPRCEQIENLAFSRNRNLEIFNTPEDTELGDNLISSTKILQNSPFENGSNHGAVNNWLKNINAEDEFALHRICSSFQPSLEAVLDTMKDKGGPKAFQLKNNIGITPSRYLKENPYADLNEKDIIKQYILHMKGEL